MQDLLAISLQGSMFVGVVLSSLLVLAALLGRLLTKPAAAGVWAISVLTYVLAGESLWLLLLWFFGSSLVASLFMARGALYGLGAERLRISDVSRGLYMPVGMPSGPYELSQVLSATLPFMTCCFAYAATGENGLLVVAVGALAASAADTWASEVGIYSEKQPVDIITRKPVQRGLSGGVSTLGLSATVISSALMGLLALAVFGIFDPALSAGGFELLLIIGCGVVGSVSDSFFGSALQAKYQPSGDASASSSSALVEVLPSSASGGAVLVSGRAWVTNDMVNLMSGMLASAFGLLFVL